MDERGQATFEYLLLAGGVVVLALLVIALMTNALQSAGSETNQLVHQGISEINQEFNKWAQQLG